MDDPPLPKGKAGQRAALQAMAIFFFKELTSGFECQPPSLVEKSIKITILYRKEVYPENLFDFFSASSLLSKCSRHFSSKAVSQCNSCRHTTVAVD